MQPSPPFCPQLGQYGTLECPVSRLRVVLGLGVSRISLLVGDFDNGGRKPRVGLVWIWPCWGMVAAGLPPGTEWPRQQRRPGEDVAAEGWRRC